MDCTIVQDSNEGGLRRKYTLSLQGEDKTFTISQKSDEALAGGRLIKIQNLEKGFDRYLICMNVNEDILLYKINFDPDLPSEFVGDPDTYPDVSLEEEALDHRESESILAKRILYDRLLACFNGFEIVDKSESDLI